MWGVVSVAVPRAGGCAAGARPQRTARHRTRHAAQDVHFLGAVRPARSASCCSAASASSAPRVEEADLAPAPRCQCVQRPCTACQVGQGRPRGARLHAEAAQRLAPLVGQQLHRLRQVQRTVARGGWGCSGRRGSGRRRRWPGRCARAPNTKATRTGGAPKRQCGARREGRRPEVARRHRGGAGVAACPPAPRPACRRCARARQDVGAPLAIATVSSRQARRQSAGAPAPGRRTP
jgi:hypothetical protein